MILFGWLQEKYEQPGGRGWLPFIFGCIAGAIPWLAILFYTVALGSDAEPLGFVYGIVVSLFAFFNVFALNQWPSAPRADSLTTSSASVATSSSA